MKYVVLYKGVKVLYMKLQQTIYGLLHSALTFYLKWSTYLKNNDFIKNTYDRCVAKKWFRGKRWQWYGALTIQNCYTRNCLK